MTERPIKFVRNEDTTTVVLEEKEKAEVLKELNSLKFAAQELQTRITDGTLEEGFKATLASLIESYTVNACKMLGHENTLVKEKEERFVQIRALNTENRELRKQLGDKISNEDVREKIKNLGDVVTAWWNVEGFGHTSEIKFMSYGVELKLSGMITDSYYDKETGLDKPDKITKLIQMGFNMDGDDVLDNDNNRGLIYDLITTRFPSAHINEYHSWANAGKSAKIRDFKVIIRNLEDLN